MSRAAQSALCFLMLAAAARAQQIASVNLPRVVVPATPSGKQARPNPCEGLFPPVMGDGLVEPSDKEPREIVVEIVGISDKAPRIGDVVRVDVRVRNRGAHPFQIPWSLDPSVRGKVQNPQNLKSGATPAEWEEGYLDVYLQGSGILKSLSQGLYSSKSSPGSQITVGPGEWVNVKTTFKIEPEFPTPGESIKAGTARLTVEWDQTAISGKIYKNGCLIGSGYFRYDDYYEQQNPATSITIR